MTLGASLLLLLLSGCATSPQGGASSPATHAEKAAAVEVEFIGAQPGSATGRRFGYISSNEAVPVVNQYSQSVRKQAEIAGAELIVCDAKGQASVAIDCARRFSSLDLDAYFIFQTTVSAASSICQAGPQVPVIGLHFPQQPCEVTNIGNDNHHAGVLGGKELGEFAKRKFDCAYDLYVSLEMSRLGEANEQRMGGFREGFTSVCGPIRDERSIEVESPTEARDRFRDLLGSVPTAKRIFVTGIADYAVLGALAAANSVSRADQVFVAGQALDPSAFCEVKNNPHFVTSVAYFPERLGEVAIPYMLKVLAGEQVPPVLVMPMVPVTADNISEYYDVSGC